MGWLGDGSHRGQGCQAWTAVGPPPRYPLKPRTTQNLIHSTRKLLRPMTHALETSDVNRLHLSGNNFWYVSCKSRTGFFWYQIPAPISTLFYSKPESDWNDGFWLVDDNCLFSAPKIFIPDAHGTKNRRRKTGVNGASFWSVRHAQDTHELNLRKLELKLKLITKEPYIVLQITVSVAYELWVKATYLL